jgi:hypothetical protein
MSASATTHPTIRAALAALLVLCGSGTQARDEFDFRADSSRSARRDPALERIWDEVNRSEELIFALTPLLQELDRSVMNLALPSREGSELFEPRVVVTDLAPGGPQPRYVEFFPSLAVGTRSWSISDRSLTVPRDTLRLWRPLLDRVAYFDHAHFKIKQGRFLDKKRHEYETQVLFSGLAHTETGRVDHVSSAQVVRWRKRGASWRIAEWRTTRMTTTETDGLLFEDALTSALPDAATLARAQGSIQEQLVVRSVLDSARFEPPHPHFTPRSLARHPAVSVVDVDRDGFDDLYVMDQWGRNMLLHNRGDGTFEEAAGRFGLDLENHTTSAIFADFDNDGDADAFLGRSLARCALLINENGRFVDRSDSLVDGPLPYLASSVSAADYDGDGLLDLHVSTYEAHLARQEFAKTFAKRRQGQDADEKILAEFLPVDEARRLYELMKSPAWHPFVNHFGPANILLRNVGGRFEIDRGAALSQVHRQTFQATWSDFDDDGDPDVYLANDYAPNNLFRNDGGRAFVDVTESTGTADFGFGMGAAWGDYDHDGKQDLYVTNMFSKAGRRITAAIPGIDPRLAQGARGNSLFRQGPLGFERVSGLEPPHLLVEEAGWGWGSQFLDVDNDGWLDIYAPSGFYTAPEEIAVPVDI